MMPINLTLTSKTAAADGLPAKLLSTDSETTQLPSFGEMLKEEEMKLLEEQECGALSIAAALAVSQPLPVAEPVPAAKADSEGGLNVSDKQPAARQIETDGLPNLPETMVKETKAANVQFNLPPAQTKFPDAPVQSSTPGLATPQSKSARVDVNIKEQVAVQTAENVDVSRAVTDVEAKTEKNAGPVIDSVSTGLPQGKPAPETQTVQLPAAAVSAAENTPWTAGQPAVKTEDAPAQSQVVEAPLPSIREVEKDIANTGPGGEKVNAEKINLRESGSGSGETPQNVNKTVKDAAVESAVKPAAVEAPLNGGQAVGRNDAAAQFADEKINQDVEPKSDSVAAAASLREPMTIKSAEKLQAPEVNTQAVDVVRQIASQMKVRIKGGSTSLRLHLNPRELGAIDVQMVRSAQGVSVTFITEQASTGQLLETQMSQLRQSLKDAGLQLTGLNISQHDQPRQEGGFFKQGAQFGEYPQRRAPQAEPLVRERERPERSIGPSGEIDYLI